MIIIHSNHFCADFTSRNNLQRIEQILNTKLVTIPQKCKA
ncbi:hypothetical protein DmAi_26850 [Acetobacter persici]|uniref:Uncharacterized protein n=1 Tax=Acetobacter persici TaxID=1076596 RepID=A0A6V8IDH8_9PROT|nr:hypothetical protein DmAi_26850 [Acetobacter persici]